MDLTTHNIWYPNSGRTKGDAAREIPLPADTETYDTAVPQDWVDAAARRLAHLTDCDLSDAHAALFGVIWLYRRDNIWGEPWPTTPRAIAALTRLAQAAIRQEPTS